VRYWAILFSWASILDLTAQFTPAFLQNSSYWTPPKSEFDLYSADLARDGQKRQCELLMIFTPKFVSAETLPANSPGKSADALPVIEMNETATVARGLVAEQLSLQATWRADTGSLARVCIAGTDGVGQIFKSFYQLRDEQAHKNTWRHRCDTYRERTELQEFEAPSAEAIVYDELPLRVRTLDLAHPAGEKDIQLLPTIVNPTAGPSGFSPAKIAWKPGEGTIEIDLTHQGGKDHFTLDADFPFLLRKWEMANGSRLTMKNSLRVDYAQYLKNGDRERALKDPMLRHPD
jgi:hypothetical protein